MLTPRTRTYNHGDVRPPLLQEVLQELCHAAQGQVLERVGDPVPQLQHIQPVPQPGQRDHVAVAEPAEGPLDQTCGHRAEGTVVSSPQLPCLSTLMSLTLSLLQDKKSRIFILNDTIHEYSCILLGKVCKDSQTPDRVLAAIPQRAETA